MTDAGALRGRGAFLTIAVLCLAVSTAYLASMFAMTGGHFVPQVADLYLIAQYARGFAEGHPFQYNPGEARTTGATSLLHTAFLGLAHAVGFRGEGLIAFAILSGALFSFFAARAAHRAGLSLSDRPGVAMLGTMLVILNGPLAWSFHYGADIALVLLLSTWLFAAWVAETPGSETGTGLAFVLPACLLAAARPEAAILVTVLGLFALRDSRGSSIRKALCLLPAATAGLVLVGLRAFTGSAANTSFSQKLLAENWGGFSAAVFSINYWSDVLRGLLLGFYPSSERLGLGSGDAPFYAPPLLLLFVLLALLRKTRGAERASQFLFAALLTALAITPTIHIGFHFNRYLLFALPPLLVLMSCGLGEAAALLSSLLNVPQDTAFRRLRAIALAFALLSVSRFAFSYGDFASSVYRKDEALFTFINQRLPGDATFLNNGSAIEYRTGRRSLNLSGVVTPGFSSLRPAETEAGSFEILSRTKAAQIPPYLIAYEAYIAGSPGWQAMVAGPPVFVSSSLDGSELAVYPTRSDLVGRQRHLVRFEPPSALAQVDTLNVSDPLDEDSHGYIFESASGPRHLFATLQLDRYLGEGRGSGTELADGGRVILGFEEFDVSTPGQGDLWLVMRTNPQAAARVRHPEGERRVDMKFERNRVRLTTKLGSTDWLETPLEPGWNEAVYRIPEALLGNTVSRIRVEGRFSSFGYWAFRAPR